MSRVSNALNMMLELEVKGAMSIDELASRIEVTPRMIKQYKNDLEMAGIYIGSIRGRNGGYFLETSRCIPNLGISEDEMKAIIMAKEIISSGKFHFDNIFQNFVNKMTLAMSSKEDIAYHNKMLYEDENILKKEKELWKNLNLAVLDKQKIGLEYKALKPEGIKISKRIIHPYGIFDYKGASYVYGYCENAKDIRFFKLSRILTYEVMDMKFEIDTQYDFSEVMSNSFGIYNDEAQKVKLKISYPMSEIVKEKIISVNQKITIIDEKNIYFEAEMQGFEEYKSWVMSMGSLVEIIEPKMLQEAVLSEALKIIEKSKKK